MKRLLHPSRASVVKRPGLLLGLLGLILLPQLAAAVPINEIRFEGNQVTREQVMRQELLLREGDEADIEKVEASRQAHFQCRGALLPAAHSPTRR
jgi:cell division septal protein FtsQ